MVNKLVRIVLLIIISVFFISTDLQSQCKDYSINVCKPSLYPYLHDGIYNAHVFSSGESAELFKTFFARQNYRLLICKPDNLPNINLVVMDTKRNVVYKSVLSEGTNTWDFNLQSSQQLIISLDIQNDNVNESGCVSVLIGLEDFY